MAAELTIKISTTADTKAIQDAIKSIDGVEKVSKTASKEIDNASSSLDGMASSVKRLIASFIGYSAISSVIKSGVELTGQYEQMKIGISSLIAVNSQNTTAMGKHIDASQKFAMAQKDSAEAIQLLRKANTETPATLTQLTQGFQSALGPAMALGFSIKETVHYSTLMTQAAAAMGVPMDQLAQEMRSILDGNIDNNSIVAKNIGLTNEQIKVHIKQGDVYDFLIGKLSDFGTAGKEMENSWNGITSSLQDSWDQFKMSTVHDSGIFDAAKSGAIELNKLLQNQNGELDSLTTSLTRHTEELVGVYAAFKAGGWITSGLTAVSGSISAITTAEEAALVSSIALEASMMRMAKFASANPIFVTVTFAAVLTESFTQVRDWLEGDKINAQGSKLLQASIAKAKDESSLEGQARSIGENYNKLSEQLNNQLAQRVQLVKASVDTKYVDAAIAKTKQALKDSQNVAKDFYNLSNSTDGLVAKPHEKTDAEKKAEEEAAKKAAIAAENLKQAYLAINKDIAGFTGNEHEKAIANINSEAENYRNKKVDEVKLAQLTSASIMALNQKEQEEKNNLLIGHYQTVGDEDAAYYLKLSMELDAMVKKGTASYAEINTFREDSDRKYLEKKAKAEFDADEASYEAQIKYLNEQRAAQLDYYTQIEDYSSAFVISESDKLQRLAESTGSTNEQMLAIWAKDNDKFQKEQWDRDHKFWADTFVNINKAMDDQFFNAMSGKFTTFGNWLKDFWSSITQSMTRGLSKSLADTIMGTGNNSDGGIANWFKSYGGFSGVMGSAAVPAALAGATTDSMGFTTTNGGTVLDAAGQITKSGSDASEVMDAVNIASTANTAYSLFTSGVTAAMYAPSAMMGQLAGTAYGAGMTGTGSFLAGGANVLAGGGVSGLSGAAYAGGLATAGIAGGIGGYALGSIGDKLLGADTKAANYGAIGGATGAIVGSVVPVIGTAIGAVVGAALGSLIGGAFGKTKTSMTGSGVQFWEEGSASNINASSYADMMSKKKSWFSSSERYWTEYGAISDSDKLKIKKTFDVYNYLLSQLDKASDVTIAAGKYAGSSFQDAMAKGFITKFTNVNTSSPEFAKIYSYWTTYASEVSKTVAEALTTSVGEYITTTRSFNEWKLGSGSVDQLKFTADYLAKDFNILSDSMGVSGLTVENYLQKYDEAIKTSFSPETITTWKNLGNALMSATDANSKYVDSLKNVQNQLLPQDMNLSKGTDASQIYQTITTQNDTLKYSFAEMISVLRNILYNQQFNGLNVGIPA